MRQKVISLILFGFILFFSCSIIGQNYNVNFQHFGIKDGLNDRHVNGISFDNSGLLWLITVKTIQRYDGYEFKTYDIDKEKYDVISFNNIGTTSDNLLWIQYLKESSQKYDLLFLDPNSNEVATSVERFGPKLSAKLEELLNSKLYIPFDSGLNSLFFIGNKDLIQFDLSGHIKRFLLKDTAWQDKIRLQIKRIDGEGRFWITASNGDKILIAEINDNELKVVKTLNFHEKIYNLWIYKSKDKIYFVSWKEDSSGKSFVHISESKDILRPILAYKKDAKFIGFIDDLFWFLKDNTLVTFDAKDQLQFTVDFKENTIPIIRPNRADPLLKGPSGKIFMNNEMGLKIFDINKSPFRNYFNKNKNYPLPFDENSIRGISTNRNNIYANVEFGGLISIPKDRPNDYAVIRTSSQLKGAYNGRPLLIDSKKQLYTGNTNFISKWNSEWKEEQFDSSTPVGKKHYANGCWALWESPDSCIWAMSTSNLKTVCIQDSISQNLTYKELGFKYKNQYVYQISMTNRLIEQPQ